MYCPIYNNCKRFASEHLAYLLTLKTPEAIVWGNADGSRNDHVWCSETEKLNQTVDRLCDLYPAVLDQTFEDFEDLYDWVYEYIIKGIWAEARVLHYDIALRIAANHRDADKLLPSAYVYLHGKPWRTAKALDDTLSGLDIRKPANYLDHIFDCGRCNPRIKEHALCHYHEEFEKIAKTMMGNGSK